MRCPGLNDLPEAGSKAGWPWTEVRSSVSAGSGKIWPRVSIVIPSFNQAPYLEEAIRSVLLQEIPDLELIIIDGGSRDGSVEIIKKYEAWLAYWISEPDRGQSHGINKGLLRCTGRYFNWHNSDDVLAPGAILKALEAFHRYPNAGVVHGRRAFIDIRSKPILRRQRTSPTVLSGFDRVEESIAHLKGGAQPGCLMDRAFVIEQGMLDENLHYVMDRDLLLRLSLRKPSFFLNEDLVFCRLYPEAKTSQANAQHAREKLIVADKIFGMKDIPEHLKKFKKPAYASAHRFAWWFYGEAGLNAPALWHFVLDVSYAPTAHWKSRRRIMKRLAESENKTLAAGLSRIAGHFFRKDKTQGSAG